MLKDFKIPLSLTVLAMVAAYLLGGIKDMLIVAVLSVLEISLSLDNAVVNASVLKNWSEKWRNRFMVFGLPVAVFGMRLVFPLLIVAVIGHIGMWEALTLAIDAPDKYAAILTSAHHQVSAFGGAFLLMVFFKFMLDTEKDEHWIGIFEGPMRHLGRITALEVALTLAIVIIASLYVPSAEQVSFLLAGAFGVISFVIAHGIVRVPNDAGVEHALCDRRNIVGQAVQQIQMQPAQLLGLDERVTDLLSRADHLMNVVLPAVLAAHPPR
ncbi:DUF475 domain-containing protein [Burkholderia ubonensis]|uniref:DUF475 domain-containing protein n=1 Tax=Burkholderia ubonensis TaxID=101571 RepID=UPI000B1095E8|nr:DUF475 domain-containing protein [Burkholderia ubonensis]